MRIPFSQLLKVMLLYIATRCKTGKMWRLFTRRGVAPPTLVSTQSKSALKRLIEKSQEKEKNEKIPFLLTYRSLTQKYHFENFELHQHDP